MAISTPDAQSYVSGLYQSVFGITPSEVTGNSQLQGYYNTWVWQLTSGNMSESQVSTAFNTQTQGDINILDRDAGIAVPSASSSVTPVTSSVASTVQSQQGTSTGFSFDGLSETTLLVGGAAALLLLFMMMKR